MVFNNSFLHPFILEIHLVIVYFLMHETFDYEENIKRRVILISYGSHSNQLASI